MNTIRLLKVSAPLLTRERLKMALLLCFFSLLISCDDISCPLESTVECHIGFYAEAEPDGEGNIIPGIKIGIGDTLTICAVRPNAEDTILVNRLVGKGSVDLPVSYYASEDIIVFAFTDTLSRTAHDTLWYQKDNVAHWDDPGCPLHYWHNITSLRFTRHLIDTVFINNSSINYGSQENFQICFRTGNE